MDIEESLKILKAWQEQSLDLDYSTVWKLGHALAEAESTAAKEFFINSLDDPNWRWRDDCISFLGFHYPLDGKILSKIRNMLLSDPSSNVRISAASVLGSQSSVPDPALSSAIQSDPDHMVRETVFEAILVLAKVSNNTIKREIKRIKTEEIQPTLEEVKRVIQEENINLPDHFLDLDIPS